MNKIRKLYDQITDITSGISSHHVAAYAAQTSYFLLLSLFPIILLLLTMVKYTPLTKADIMTAVIQLFPSTVTSLITSIVNQVYSQSLAMVPLTLLVTLWAAGKGVLALATGLNNVYSCVETRNYVILRIRATLYTVMMLMVIIVLLVLAVFGNTLDVFIGKYLPFVADVYRKILGMRSMITSVIMIFFTLIVYKFLPNRKCKFLSQIPGAVFATIGWMAVSWIFSVYLDIFTGFSTMYGSLTTIILVLLWMYFCMYCILLGGEVNVRMEQMFLAYESKEEDTAEEE